MNFYYNLNGLIISTNNMFHGIASTYLAVNWPYIEFFLFLWQVLQTLTWVHMSSLKSVQ